MKSPKVTVLMPVYNGEKYLSDAIKSILDQDFTDFEFLIINDGSTDGSVKIIESFSDSRIRLVNNEKNIGLVNSLNKGFELAKGEYIARMDCDDISLKNRLSVQVKFMDNNSGVGASGSFYYLLLNDKKAVADFPVSQEEMKCFMVFNCPIAHPSAIIRTSIVQKDKLQYRSEFIHAEDYDLWSQISETSNLANVSDVLLTYRVHENQITGHKNTVVAKKISLNGIRSRHLNKLGIVPSAEELELHNLISDGLKPANDEQIKKAEEWLKKIILENQKRNVFNESYLGKIVLERWLRFCYNYWGGRKGIKYFMSSELRNSIKLPLKQKFEFYKNLYITYKRKGIKG